MRFSVMVISACFAASAFAGPNQHHPVAKISPEFENLKGLIGNWEGTSVMAGKQEPVKVSYELTSGGTAIIEKLMPGSPHEMVTIYANRGKQVGLVHYCALGNQPEMKLIKASGGIFDFQMDGTKGIQNKNEMHMHSVTLTLNGNKLKHEWTNFKDNKKGEVAVFEFTKKN